MITNLDQEKNSKTKIEGIYRLNFSKNIESEYLTKYIYN
mgnify:CR=1 FL=1